MEPFSTTYKANASYLVPKIDVQVSGTFSSRPGAVLRADAIYQANDPTILATLGRPLAATPNVTVPLIAPYEAYGDRIDQVDMRIGKILRFGRTRSNISLDIVNLFNSNDNLAYGTLLSADVAGADAGAPAADLPRQLRHRLVGCRVQGGSPAPPLRIKPRAALRGPRRFRALRIGPAAARMPEMSRPASRAASRSRSAWSGCSARRLPPRPRPRTTSSAR